MKISQFIQNTMFKTVISNMVKKMKEKYEGKKEG